LWSYSLFPLARNGLVSASPDKLKWSIVDTPCEEGYVVASPSEINAFVLGSDEVFYAIDIAGRKVHKSTDSGVTWEDDLTEALEDEGANLPAWDIAVAPDGPELVAVVTDDRQEVYVSEDGGDSWTNTHVSDAPDWDATLLIADIAISPQYDGTCDIAIGTRDPDGGTNGDVWVIRQVPFVGWEVQELNMDVISVRFSPNYDGDKTLLAIASDIDNTCLCTGVRNTDENTTAVGTMIGNGSYGNPVAAVDVQPENLSILDAVNIVGRCIRTISGIQDAPLLIPPRIIR
ncbi:unnamed protein product, partial [marine sediment metagenome]